MSVNKSPEDIFKQFCNSNDTLWYKTKKYNYYSGYYIDNLSTLLINKILCGTKWWSIYSLRAMFASFLVCLTQKVEKIWNSYVLEKYLQNIVKMSVEVSRDSKVFKMRDAQGYHQDYNF